MVVLREDQDITHYAMQVCAKPIFEKVTHTRTRREQQSGVEEQKIRQQTGSVCSSGRESLSQLGIASVDPKDDIARCD